MPGANAIDVARQLLNEHKSLSGLSRCTVEQLKKFAGSVPPKRFIWWRPFSSVNVSRTSGSSDKSSIPRKLVYELLAPEMRALHKESLRVILLDTRYHHLSTEQVSLGSVNESIAHPRDVFRPAVVASAYAVIVVHNHPSGDPSPSQSDHSLTRRLVEAAELLQIKLLDHVIIGAPAEGRQPYFSFKEAGVL